MNGFIHRRGWRFVGVALVLLAASLVLVVLFRKPLAGFAAQAYLEGLGVPSTVTVTRLDMSGLSAGLRLGADDPVTVERVDVAFAKLGLSPQISSVHVLRPVLRAAYTQNRWALGPLQALMDHFAGGASGGASGPPSPPIDIVIEDATVTLDTAAGSLALHGNAALRGAVLKSLEITSNDAALALGPLTGHVRTLDVHVVEEGAALRVSVRAQGDAAFQNGGGAVAATGLALTLDVPALRLDAASGTLNVAAEQADLTLTADSAQIFGDHLQAPHLKAQATQAALASDAGTYALSGGVALDLSSSGGDIAGVLLRHAVADLKGSARTGQTPDFNLTGAAKLDTGLAPSRLQSLARTLQALPPADRKALTGQLQAVTLDMPSFAVSGKGADISATLTQVVTVTGAAGTRVVVAVPAGGTLLALHDGAFSGGVKLALSGGRLPAVDLAVSSYTFAQTPVITAAADIDLSLRGAVAGVSGVALKTGGQVRLQGEDMSYTPRACADLAAKGPITAADVVVGDAALSICPRSNAPLVQRNGNTWRFAGSWSKGRAVVSGARIAELAGALDVTMDADGLLRGDVSVGDILLADTQAAPRFAPLRAAARAQLEPSRYRATLTLSSADRRYTYGTAALTHAPRTKRGEARLDFPHIAFTPDGLQPADLAPQMDALEQATGAFGFVGRIAWNGIKIASAGTLSLRDLAFGSPAGMIRGLQGAIQFDSLVPPATAPNQKLNIAGIDWMIPLTNAAAAFSFGDLKLKVDAVTAQMAGGAIAVDPFVIDLNAEPVLQSTLRLENVDLGPVVASTNFADRIQLAVKVQGAVPFSVAASGIQFQKGQVQSVAPGHLAIARALWTGPDQAPVNAVQDFAYQAMEHLAMDSLTGEINSIDQNRLGLVLRVKGRHDPLTPGQTRIGLLSLLKGEAFNTPIPLPDKTPVDLTLDMSLNFAEILRAYGEAFAQVRKLAR